jgi:hypothetical protein
VKNAVVRRLQKTTLSRDRNQGGTEEREEGGGGGGDKSRDFSVAFPGFSGFSGGGGWASRTFTPAFSPPTKSPRLNPANSVAR